MVHLIMKENIIVSKSYNFAIEIVSLYKFLTENKREFVLSKQVLRSGTSIGANMADAQGSISKREFIAKVHISFKEAYETRYWLNILSDTAYISKEQFVPLNSEINQIIKILTSILKSSKS